MMTPQEVANCTFSKSTIGGYSMAAVDNFLDRLTEDYSALYKENAALKSKLKVLADKTAEYREVEDAMRATLLTAQKMSANMVSEAEKKRDEILAGAEEERKKRMDALASDEEKEEERLRETRRRVDRELENEDKRLAEGKRRLREFIDSVKGVCQEELELLELLPELPVEEEPAKEPESEPGPAAGAKSDAAKAAQPPAEKEDAPATERAGDGKEPSESGEDASPAGEAPDGEPDGDKDGRKDGWKKLLGKLSPGKKDETGVWEVPEDAKPAPRRSAPGDPFDSGPLPDPAEDLSETRVVNLDDLQFGRNYVKDKD